jgi:hypothetical protein
MGAMIKIDTPLDGAIFAIGTYILMFVISLFVAGIIWSMTRILRRRRKNETGMAAGKQ